MLIKLSVDDGTADDARVDQLMVKYGLEKNVTYYWPVMLDYCNGRKGRASLTEQQMQDIASHSLVGAHGMTHTLLTRVPLELARREIFDSKDVLQQKFNREITSFAYPRGYANPDIQKLVQQAGYQSARGVTVGYIYQPENPFYEQTTVHCGIDRKEYAGQPWLDYALYMLEQARYTTDSVYHAWFHSWELTKNNAWDDLEILLKELANG